MDFNAASLARICQFQYNSNMFERFSEPAVRVIMAAQSEAQRLKSSYVGAEHLLLAMIREQERVVIKTLEAFDLSGADLKETIESEIKALGESFTGKEIPFSSQVKKIIEFSWEEARSLGHSYVGVEHLFLAILREGTGLIGKILNTFGINYHSAKERTISLLAESAIPKRKIPSKAQTPVLDSFGRDLTNLARSKKLDPVIGRNKEIERVIQILSRRKKNNPVLIGEAGVGKTAIVEGLAQRIISANVPPPLLNKRVVTLDLGLLIAGTRYRGEFEERVKKILEELRKIREVILFIDELHTLIGAGAAEGAMDAANILKPALARGELQCIGATTPDEYRKRIEQDPALERRFQSVMVNESTVEETTEILKGLRGRYEEFHKVRITDDALVSAARLSDRYISERKLPDKAIDLIDEAASKVMLQFSQAPPRIIELTKEIEEIRAKKELAIQNQEFEAAARLRDREEEIKTEYEKESKGISISYENLPEVNSEKIAEVISAWTGVPLTQLTTAETERLLSMEEVLKKRIIGQEEAISKISRSIRRARAGLKSPRRPIGSFIFAGPSGVGKTELAKRIAEFIFGDIDAIVRIDMSEYLESHTVSRLVGSPPGYVGFGEGGQLSEPVRRKPHSVVLFDEIEKSHLDVLNVLLQILDEGMITDAQGRKVDFRNTVIIMTSNLGAEFVNKETSIGFLSRDNAAQSYQRIKDRILEEIKKKFRPEFLNRIDETIIFRPLAKEDLKLIVRLFIEDLNKRVEEKGLNLIIKEKVLDFIVEKGFDPKLGARPLRRAVEEYIEDPLSEDVLKGKFTFGAKIKADIKKGEIVFTKARTTSEKQTAKELQEVTVIKTRSSQQK
jgi:ATP-dependent Clp protease ATP-binding subunit ClpC